MTLAEKIAAERAANDLENSITASAANCLPSGIDRGAVMAAGADRMGSWK
ncbi:MAG: hypothetical protein R2867_07755 [Caldilineaceae bacterium]